MESSNYSLHKKYYSYKEVVNICMGKLPLEIKDIPLAWEINRWNKLGLISYNNKTRNKIMIPIDQIDNLITILIYNRFLHIPSNKIKEVRKKMGYLLENYKQYL